MLPDLQAQPRPGNAPGFRNGSLRPARAESVPGHFRSAVPRGGQARRRFGVIAAPVLAGRKLVRGNVGQGSPENEIGFDAL